MVQLVSLVMCLLRILIRLECVTSLNSTEREDDIANRSVTDFTVLCPYTDICYSNASSIQRGQQVAMPCCFSCKCDADCEKDCCPDKPERYLNNDEIESVKNSIEQCVYAQFRMYNDRKLNGKSYDMVVRCPADYKDDEVEFLCMREYHNFRFDEDDIKTFMPVSSDVSNVTFRNYYCAICHNATDSDLRFWNTEIQCIMDKKLLISNPSEIASGLAMEDMCQVIFRPSDVITEVAQPCQDGFIARCNVTGNWETGDHYLESACLSYTSEYSGYKNIHCFLCNGHNMSDIEQLCELQLQPPGLLSFVALLDFNNLDGASTHYIRNKEVKECSTSSRYDPLTATCKVLTCATGLMLSANRCVPLYQTGVLPMDTIIYGIQFNLVPTHIVLDAHWTHLGRVSDIINSDVFSKLLIMYTTRDISICGFKSYVKLKHSLGDTLLLMSQENITSFAPFVSHMSVVIQLTVFGVRNVSAILEELAMMYSMNEMYGQYIVQFPKDDIKGMPTGTRLSSEYVELLINLSLGSFQFHMFRVGVNDIDDGLGVLFFDEENTIPRECEPVIAVQPYPFCPRVELKNSEFTINYDRKTAKVISRADSINSSRYASTFFFSKIIYPKFNDSIFVCADEYFAQLQPENATTLPQNRSDKSDVGDDYQLAVLTVVCLVFSIVSLLLTFLVYCLLPHLRSIPGLNNMGLVLNLLLSHGVTLINVIARIELAWLCSALGVFLHFTLLSSFFWMFICTYHMMTVFIKIKARSLSGHPLRTFVRYFSSAALSAGLLVACTIVVVRISGSDSIGYGGSICYIQDSKMIIYFVAVPLGFVLIANATMFLFVVVKVVRMPDMAANSNHERKNIIILVKLSTITGLTWIFGFLYQFTEVVLFGYAYIIFNAGQGVFIMLSFICNRRVLDMLRNKTVLTKASRYAESTTVRPTNIPAPTIESHNQSNACTTVYNSKL